jgi:hypothetical protein
MGFLRNTYYYTRKNPNVYLYQSRITLHTLPWDTLHNIDKSEFFVMILNKGYKILVLMGKKLTYKFWFVRTLSTNCPSNTCICCINAVYLFSIIETTDFVSLFIKNFTSVNRKGEIQTLGKRQAQTYEEQNLLELNHNKIGFFPKLGNWWVMTLKHVEVRVLITELHYVGWGTIKTNGHRQQTWTDVITH